MSREPPEPVTVRELRRGQIVAAARAIVAERGLDALTFSALEERLSFSRGAITWHFRDKRDLVHAVLEDAIDQIDADTHAAAKAEPDLSARLRAVIRRMTTGWLSSNAGATLVAFWGTLGSDVDAAGKNVALYRRYRAYSTELVRLGQQRGEFAPEVDPDAMGAVIVGMVQGVALQALFDPGAVPLDRAIEAAADAVLARLCR
ncbi:MAG: TetR/AcrR family transcriptional regulator [Myxococcota bacterium]